MNALLSAVFIALGLLPGVVIWHSYFRDPLSRRALELPRGLEFGWYLFLAVPLLLAWMTLGPDRYSPSFTQVAQLHDYMSLADTDRKRQTLNAWALRQGLGWLGLVVVAYGLGSIARRIVWSLRLDLRLRPLQLRNDWYYPLQGRLKGLPRDIFPIADVLATDTHESRLYKGVVTDFDLAEDGNLAALTLRNVQRGKGRGDDFEWADVPGDRLIILGERIHSINLTYVEPVTDGEGEKQAGPERSWDRMIRRLKAVAWSFFTLQP